MPTSPANGPDRATQSCYHDALCTCCCYPRLAHIHASTACKQPKWHSNEPWLRLASLAFTVLAVCQHMCCRLVCMKLGDRKDTHGCWLCHVAHMLCVTYDTSEPLRCTSACMRAHACAHLMLCYAAIPPLPPPSFPSQGNTRTHNTDALMHGRKDEVLSHVTSHAPEAAAPGRQGRSCVTSRGSAAVHARTRHKHMQAHIQKCGHVCTRHTGAWPECI